MKKTVRILFLLLCLGVFLYSGSKLGDYILRSRQNKALSQALTEEFVLPLTPAPRTPVPATAAPVSGEPAETPEPLDPDPGPGFQIDFEALKRRNPDAIGWLWSEDTPINYPVMRSRDHNQYLNHSIDHVYDGYGCLFLDYRCDTAFRDPMSVIYGHDMKNDSMFGTLDYYKRQSYYEEHPLVYLLTPEQSYRVELFAGYITPSSSFFYQLPASDEQRDTLAAEAKAGSTFRSAVAPVPGERVLLLSTCTYEYENARFVLLGRLVPIAGPA